MEYHFSEATARSDHDNIFTEAMRLRYFTSFILALNALFLGATIASAVPQLGAETKYTLLHLTSKSSVLTKREEKGPAKLIESVTPSARRRRPLHALRQEKSSPEYFRHPLEAPLSLLAHHKQKVGSLDTKMGTYTRRILSTEEASAVEETHAHDEEVSEDGSDEKEEYEEGDESDEDDDVYEEHTEEEQVEKKDSTKSEKSVYSAEPHEPPHKEKSTVAVQELSKTIRTAADEEEPEDRIHHDVKGEHEHEHETERTSTSEKEKVNSETERGAKKSSIFRGVPGGEIDGTNITHISYMLYKIVKSYDIKTVLDIPCRNNLNWFPQLLQQMDFEIMGFKYICVDEGVSTDRDLHARFSEAGSPEFLGIPPNLSHDLPQSDLVFSYDGPQQWGVRLTWSFFTGLRKRRPKYIIVTNNPGQMNNDKEHVLNLRKQPFHFSQAMRVISNIHTTGKPKQLVFYETEQIREGF